MKVAVLCGGRYHERAVSLRSGARVADALERLGHEAIIEDVGPSTTRHLRDGGFDAAFVALHGRGGDDGGIQSMLELLELPYTGSRPGPSAAAFDKVRAKRALRNAGIDTPEFVSLTETALQEFGAADALEQARDSIGFPLVVKPVSGGSALGVSYVDDDGDLPRALLAALSYDRHVLLERYVVGREVAVCLVADQTATDGLMVCPPVRIIPRRSDWFDFEARYTHGETEFSCPPDGVSAAEVDVVIDVARRAFTTLGLRGFGRVDIILDDDGRPWVLELATVPGMTETSLVPLAAEAAGLSFNDFVRLVLDDAIRVAPAPAS